MLASCLFLTLYYLLSSLFVNFLQHFLGALQFTKPDDVKVTFFQEVRKSLFVRVSNQKPNLITIAVMDFNDHTLGQCNSCPKSRLKSAENTYRRKPQKEHCHHITCYYVNVAIWFFALKNVSCAFCFYIKCFISWFDMLLSIKSVYM